jgi:hypothetical protein
MRIRGVESLVRVARVIAPLVLMACGNGTTITTTCNLPGYTMGCSCADGHFGKQTCGNDGQFSACECPVFDAGGGGGSRIDASGSGDGSAGGDGSSIAAGTLLSSGTSRLLDVFVTPAGIVVATADGISIVDRKGTQLHMLAAPREITAVAFDGTLLAVADKAILTTYTADLAPLGMATLMESCVGVAVVSGSRVICAGQPNFPTKFYAFNGMSGAALETTMLATQTGGSTLRRVLGKDDLVSLESSVSAFQLLNVDATSLVSSTGSSPFGHTYHASAVFAFAGNPADHVITEDGIFASIYGPMCDKSLFTNSQCFVQDGALGTLRGAEKFIGLDGADGAGKAYALVDTPSSSFDTRHCISGCAVEQIDVTARVVQTQKSYSLNLGQTVAVRHDATGNGLVVGYAAPGASSSVTAPYPGYRVELLGYQ